MALDLSKVGKREDLKAQREPHWQRLRGGCFLGYRPSKRGGAGTWIARVFDADANKYRVKSLGDFGALPPNERFVVAKKEAEKLAELIESGGEFRPKVETVADACREYLKERPGSIAEGVFRRHVYDDPIAKVKLAKLRRHHVKEWRKRLEEALRPFKNADKRRLLYLDKIQRRKLLNYVEAEAEPFVRALCLLPLRPGAMAALVAGDFDKRTSELTIGKDKAEGGRRILIPAGAASLFRTQAKGKLPGAPMFMRAGGKEWDRNTWGDAIEDAVRAARLPARTTAYTLRHSTITDLVTAGLPLLTIAQISGTSAEMIERHYGHLSREAAVKALEALAL